MVLMKDPKTQTEQFILTTAAELGSSVRVIEDATRRLFRWMGARCAEEDFWRRLSKLANESLGVFVPGVVQAQDEIRDILNICGLREWQVDGFLTKFRAFALEQLGPQMVPSALLRQLV